MKCSEDTNVMGKGFDSPLLLSLGGDAELERHTWAVGYGHIYLPDSSSVPIGIRWQCPPPPAALKVTLKRGGTASVPLEK